MAPSSERDSLILNMADLAREDQDLEQQSSDSQYASSEQAFFNQPILEYVADEVHAMLQFFFCEISCCTSFWNPLYLVLFAFLYIFTFPGAVLHWLLLKCFPVKRSEYAEEREMRGQGLYTVISIALYCIPFGVTAVCLSTKTVRLVSGFSVIVNICIILYCLIAFKAMADNLCITIRTFTVGIWLIDLIMIILIFFDVRRFLNKSPEVIFIFAFRCFEIIVYTIVAVQFLPFWDIYEGTLYNVKKVGDDIGLSLALMVLAGVVVVCLAYTIIISEEYAWRLFSF